MNLSADENRIIDTLLNCEHERIAFKLKFISKPSTNISTGILERAIGLIDEISRHDDEVSKRIAITLSAILWIYKDPNWEGLKDFLLLTLSRIGFSPSTLMIDEDFDIESNTYSSLHSIVGQFAITYHQLKYEVAIGKRVFLLTEFQKNTWAKMDECNLLGISAPTSAGKSFILLLKCIDLLLKKPGNIVYIVPTLSLVSQVSLEFRNLFRLFGLHEYEILTTFYEREQSNKRVFVLTQEKAIAAFSQQESPFNNLRLLIVDEIQNVERVADEDEQRAKTLYDTLMEFRHISSPDKTVISGPRIEQIGELGSTIFGSPAHEEQTKGSPVVNFTYAISKVGTSYYFRQYTDIRQRPNSIPIMFPSPIDGHGKIQYRKHFHEYLSHIIAQLGPLSYNIIFSPTSNQARRTAVAISELVGYQQGVNKLDSLIQYVSSTVHPDYDLCKTLSKGVAYHHGKAPAHIRRAVERAMREKWINNVVCTTTLMQGVNLPAQTVIIRNPYLYVSSRFGNPKLTNYEIANLRGRAGRLLKDFIGRTYVLDENSFEDSDEQSELFAESRKQLNPGYGEKYEQHEKGIIGDLLNLTPPTNENQEYSFLLTYIRQVALKYNQKGLERLHNVGIGIDKDRFLKITQTLTDLRVPKEICFKNRYWDPLDLNKLFGASNQPAIPLSIGESNITNKLLKLIKFMNDQFPIYARRYFKADNDKVLLSNCINAEHWLKEWPLRKILGSDYYDNSDKIEKTISVLQNAVSFGLPMLLKPIYDIKSEKSMFLRFIEMGAHRPATRRMIELNVPRETAIILTDKYFGSCISDDEDVDAMLRSKIKSVYGELDFWDQVQLEPLM